MSALPVANESEATFSRYTKGGRKLTYSLRVLQEPQRARACGSGAKSSADRRPVDPPPVIELKVLEGEQKSDITFSHKANFFIFVTLENARPIAQARGQPAAQPPVLTGSPVSGAALLDRPSPAAYFIFPDLSVRHEGKYRLSFNLYEELKDPADEDATPMTAAAPGMLSMMAQAAVRFRMEVRSKPFVVYSAKKFPGLTESTSLSRVVAEQGCRVRIRRDVRMRRRENKGSKDSSDRDDGSYSSYSDPVSAGGDPYRQSSIEQQQQHTPSSTVESGYYASSSSYPTPTYTHAQVPQYAPSARPSSQHQHFHPGPAASATVDGSALSSNQYGQPYGAYGTPHSSHTRHPSSVSSHESLLQSYQAGPPPTAQQALPPPPPPLNAAPPPSSYSQLPPEPQASSARSSYPEFDTSTYSKYSDQMSYGRVAIDNNYQTSIPPAPYAADPRSNTPGAHSLPPLKSLPTVDARHDTSPSYAGVPDIYNMGHMTGASLAASIRAGSKRGYERTFDAGLGISMSNGARPTAAGQDVPQIETDEGLVDVDELLGMKTLSYRRANGSLQTKKIPSASEVC